MNRRHFIALTLAAGTGIALGAGALRAQPLDYMPGLARERLAAGETVFLDFTASWCSTCAAQERVLKRLKAANPAYEANVTFIDVDWDAYGNSDLAQTLNIPRRSTLVVLRGDRELGRLVAQTSEAQIKSLLDTALGAAG